VPTAEAEERPFKKLLAVLHVKDVVPEWDPRVFLEQHQDLRGRLGARLNKLHDEFGGRLHGAKRDVNQAVAERARWSRSKARWMYSVPPDAAWQAKVTGLMERLLDLMREASPPVLSLLYERKPFVTFRELSALVNALVVFTHVPHEDSLEILVPSSKSFKEFKKVLLRAPGGRNHFHLQLKQASSMGFPAVDSPDNPAFHKQTRYYDHGYYKRNASGMSTIHPDLWRDKCKLHAQRTKKSKLTDFWCTWAADAAQFIVSSGVFGHNLVGLNVASRSLNDLQGLLSGYRVKRFRARPGHEYDEFFVSTFVVHAVGGAPRGVVPRPPRRSVVGEGLDEAVEVVAFSDEGLDESRALVWDKVTVGDPGAVQLPGGQRSVVFETEWPQCVAHADGFLKWSAGRFEVLVVLDGDSQLQWDDVHGDVIGNDNLFGTFAAGTKTCKRWGLHSVLKPHINRYLWKSPLMREAYALWDDIEPKEPLAEEETKDPLDGTSRVRGKFPVVKFFFSLADPRAAEWSVEDVRRFAEGFQFYFSSFFAREVTERGGEMKFPAVLAAEAVAFVGSESSVEKGVEETELDEEVADLLVEVEGPQAVAEEAESSRRKATESSPAFPVVAVVCAPNLGVMKTERYDAKLARRNATFSVKEVVRRPRLLYSLKDQTSLERAAMLLPKSAIPVGHPHYVDDGREDARGCRARMPLVFWTGQTSWLGHVRLACEQLRAVFGH